MADKSSQELAVISESVALEPEMTRDQLARIRDIFSGAVEYEVEEVDAQAIAGETLNRLLFADSEEQLLKELPTWSSKDHVGETFVIHPRGRVYRSSFVNENGNKGAFLSMQAVDANGELGILNTSSPYIVGKVGWYATQGRLPAPMKITQRGESSKGRPILDIELAQV